LAIEAKDEDLKRKSKMKRVKEWLCVNCRPGRRHGDNDGDNSNNYYYYYYYQNDRYKDRIFQKNVCTKALVRGCERRQKRDVLEGRRV
jgi:hypothetical protein